MDINDFRKLCNDEAIQISEHCYKRCIERKISYDDIKNCIHKGKIIEEYPNDYPHPSALVMECETAHPLHVVARLSDEHLWIITAYRPDPDQWESDYKTRKEI